MKGNKKITIIDTTGRVLQCGMGGGVRVVSECRQHIVDISEVSDGVGIDIFFKMDEPRAFNSTPDSSEQGMLPQNFEFLLKRTVALATNEDVIDLAARIADNWTLCQLFEGTHRASEAEYMVATTVHACKINLDKEGEAFSWVHPSVHVRSGNGLADNPTAFAMLIREAYVVEDERDGKPILRMTQKLVDVLRGHLAKKGS